MPAYSYDPYYHRIHKAYGSIFFIRAMLMCWRSPRSIPNLKAQVLIGFHHLAPCLGQKSDGKKRFENPCNTMQNRQKRLVNKRPIRFIAHPSRLHAYASSLNASSSTLIDETFTHNAYTVALDVYKVWQYAYTFTINECTMIANG